MKKIKEKKKLTEAEILAEKQKRWNEMKNLAKSFARQAGIKIEKPKKKENYDY